MARTPDTAAHALYQTGGPEGAGVVNGWEDARQAFDDLQHSRSRGVIPSKYGPDTHPAYSTPGGKPGSYRELLITKSGTTDSNQFTSSQGSHWNEPDVLAHVRLQELTDKDGKRVLLVDEVQSDWAQKGRKKGFESTGGPIPNGPFVEKTDAWAALAMKRVMRYAAENGYDRVAWTPGALQNERYSLEKAVGEISWEPFSSVVHYDEPVRFVTIKAPNGSVVENGVKTQDDLEAMVGEELADRVFSGDDKGSLSGMDLKVGGEGMRGFYDRILPKVAGDLGKKFGAKVRQEPFSLSDAVDLHTITPEGVMDLVGRQQSREAQGALSALADVMYERPELDAEDALTFMRRNGVLDSRGISTAEDALRVAQQGNTSPLHVMDITPAMRDAALHGEPLSNGKRAPGGFKIAQADARFATHLATAAAGGAAGYASTPDDATAQERIARTVGGAAGASLLGEGALHLATNPVARKAVSDFLADEEGALKLPFGPKGAPAVKPSVPIPTGSPIKGVPVAGDPGQPTTNLARQAEAFLRDIQGTAKENAQLRPDEADHIGNIYTAGFTKSTRKLIDQAFTANNEFAGGRQGVIKDRELARRANEWAQKNSIEIALKDAGYGGNPEAMAAVGYTVDKAGREYDKALQARTAGMAAGTWTGAQEALVVNQGLVMQALIGKLSKDSSDAGRTLRAVQVYQKALRGNRGLNEDAVKRAVQQFAGSPHAFTNWMAAWKTTDPNDYTARYKLLGALKSPGKMETALFVRMGNMLSGIPTMVVNATHGVIQSLYFPVTRSLRGDFKPAAAYLPGFVEAAGQSGKNGMEAFWTGIGPEGAKARMLHDEEGITGVPVSGKKGMILTPGNRVNGAIDEAIRTMTIGGFTKVAAMEEAERTGATVQDLLANPTTAMLKRADQLTEDALRGTTDGKVKNPVLRGMLAWRRLATHPVGDTIAEQTASRAVGLVGHAAVPFAMIPEYIARNGTKILAGPVAYPALAAGKTLGAVTGKERFIGGRAYSAAERAQLGKDARGDLVMGLATSAVLAFLYEQSREGNITGMGPADEKQRAAWLAAGNQPHSIRAFGRWWDANVFLGPLAVPAAFMASVVEGARDEDIEKWSKDPENFPEWVGLLADATSYVIHNPGKTAGSTATSLSQHPMIQALGTLADMVHGGNGPGKDALQAASDFTGATLSTFVLDSGLANTLSNTGLPGGDDRKKAPEDPGQYVASRIPFLKQGVPNQVDPFGQEIHQQQDLMSMLPGRPRPAQVPTDVASEVYRLNQIKDAEHPGGHSMNIPAYSATAQRTGGSLDTVDQTAAQIRTLARDQGQAALSSLNNLIKSPDYQAAPDARKIEMMNDALAVSNRLGNLSAGSDLARDPARSAGEPLWGRDDPTLQRLAKLGIAPPNAPQEFSLGQLATLPFTKDEQRQMEQRFHELMADRMDELEDRLSRTTDEDRRQVYARQYMNAVMAKAQAEAIQAAYRDNQLRQRMEMRKANPAVTLAPSTAQPGR